MRLIGVLCALFVLLPATRASANDDLRDYARTTWASMAAMTDPQSGLPADRLNADGTTSVQTSTTNIGAYLWSAVAAQRLGIISQREEVARLSKTVTSLEHMERYANTGQYYNWYDHHTGARMPDAATFTNWLSSVDDGWLAVGLKIVSDSVPQL